MKTSIKALIFILAFLSSAAAFAQGGPVVVNGNHVSLVAPDATPSSVKIQVPNAGGSYEVWTGGTKRLSLSGAGVLTEQSGTVRAVPAYVPTMAATPVAGTNAYIWGVNAVPTAAANTSAFLPTPVAAGQKATIINTMANAVRISAGGTNTINGGSAGGYIPLAAAAIADCESTSTSAVWCGTRAVPTPAGP